MLLDADVCICNIFWLIVCPSTHRQENPKHPWHSDKHSNRLLSCHFKPQQFHFFTRRDNLELEYECIWHAGTACPCISASTSLWLTFPNKGIFMNKPPLKCHTAIQNCTRKKVKKIEAIVGTATYSSALPPSQENTADDYTKKSWINKEFLKHYCKLQ